MNRAIQSRRGGFTLVELLIVIIIIAILAGMMMLTTGSATDRAEATKIINDLRALKAATLMYYVDNNRTWPAKETDDSDGAAKIRYDKSLSKYMDRSLDKRYRGVWLRASDESLTRIYVGVYVGRFDNTDGFSNGVLKKLEEARYDAGLFGTTTATNATYFIADSNWHVYMPVR